MTSLEEQIAPKTGKMEPIKTHVTEYSFSGFLSLHLKIEKRH